MNHQPGPTSAAPFASTRRPISRRRFLRGAGVALALPLLESMRAPFARAADGPGAAAAVLHLQQPRPAARSSSSRRTPAATTPPRRT